MSTCFPKMSSGHSNFIRRYWQSHLQDFLNANTRQSVRKGTPASKRNSSSSLLKLTAYLALSLSTLVFSGLSAAQSIPNNTYRSDQLYKSVSRFDYVGARNSNGGGFAAVQAHRGFLVAPGSFDHGGGEFRDGRKSGKIQIYNISDVNNPRIVYDTADNQSRFYDTRSAHYIGDISEIHAIPMWGDYMLLPRRKDSAYGGFVILDLGPFFKGTGDIAVVGRYTHSGPTSNYDGFPFSLTWLGGKYAYLAMGPQGLHVVDTTDMRNPQLVKTIGTSTLGSRTLITTYTMANTLIVSHTRQAGTKRVVLFDITNPRDPQLIRAIGDAKIRYATHFDGRYLFNNGLDEVGAYDLTDPSNPRYRMINSRPNYRDLGEPEYGESWGDYYITGTVNGFVKYRLRFPNEAQFIDDWFEQGPGNDYAFTTVFGNLAISTSDHADAVSFITPHDSARDTSGPEVTVVKPANRSTRVAITMPIGIAFDERLDASTVTDDTFIVRDVSGNRVSGRASVVGNRVQFLPDSNFSRDSTYEVLMPRGGIKDALGNGLGAEQSYVFSTGGSIDRFACRLNVAPITAGDSATISVEVTGGSSAATYSWNFGDGQSTNGSSASVRHTYNNPQRYSVEVEVRDGSERCVAAARQIVSLPKSDVEPMQSATMVFDAQADGVWNVNPDNDTVTLTSANSLRKVAEISVGKAPWALALGPRNELWVVNSDSASISVIDRSTRQVRRTISLKSGSAPGGIVFDSAQAQAFVTLQDLGVLQRINASSYALNGQLDVGPHPRGIARTSDNTLLVNRFISEDAHGQTTVVDAGNFRRVSQIDYALSRGTDVQDFSRGLPNYLGNLAISPDGSNAMIPAKKDNIQRGGFRDGRDLGHDSTVRSIGLKINLDNSPAEVTRDRMDFDNMDMATAVAYSPDGTLAFFATLGSSQLVAVDVFDVQDQFTLSSVGDAPLGIVIDPQRNNIFVHNFMSRTVSVLAADDLMKGTGSNVTTLASVPVVAEEKLPAQILRGKKLFYDTKDGRLASEGYMSCASCHFDGGHDGRTWDLSNMGEGLRNTIELNGRGGAANLHGIRHWSANFDEVQDFENQIRALNNGTGLLSDAQFNNTKDPLGNPKAGLSRDLDSLAAYVNSLANLGMSPYRDADGGLSTEAEIGQQVFTDKNCASCHAGKAFTDSAQTPHRAHDVGTYGPGSGERLGGPLNGFDTPTLSGLWASAPYLHNGSAATLMDVLDNTAHVGDLSQSEKNNLQAFLLQIDDSMAADTTQGIVSGGVYQIVNRATGRSLDVEGGSTADIANVQTFAYRGNPWQQWEVVDIGGAYIIRARHSGKVVNIEGGSNGTDNLIQYPYSDGHLNSQWRIDSLENGYYTVVSVDTGEAMDERVSDHNVTQYPLHSRDNQQWQFVPVSGPAQPTPTATPVPTPTPTATPVIVSGDTYVITNRATNRVLDVAGGRNGNGANVVTWPYAQVAWEHWVVSAENDGSYSIIAEHSGKALNVSKGEDAGNVIQWPYGGEANARWRFEPAGDGYFVLISVDSGQALDEAVSRNDVQQYQRHGNANQQWRFDRVGS